MGNTAMEAVRTRIQKRVKLSEALLTRMGITPEAYERTVLNALIANPDLGECTIDSLDAAVIKCIQSGLIPDGEQAALVPFAKVATLLPMIPGRLMLARRATPGIALRARCVYASDEFVYEEGLLPILKHIPNKKASRGPDEIVAAYATARVPGSAEPEFEVLFRDEIDRYRARGGAGKRGSFSPWESDYGEMAEKTVLGLLLKRLPKRVDDPPMPQGINYMDWEDGPIIPDHEGTARLIEGEATPVDATGTPSGETTAPAQPQAQPQAQTQQRRRRAAAKPKPEPQAQPAADATPQGGSPFAGQAPPPQQQPAPAAEGEDIF